MPLFEAKGASAKAWNKQIRGLKVYRLDKSEYGGGNKMQLVKLSRKNIWDVVHLQVTPEQDEQDFVASNGCSVIEAFAVREDGYVALPFALYESGRPVGFLMIGYDSIGDEDEPSVAQNNYTIWRLMIDKRFQGQGLGTRAMEAALDYIRTWPCGKADYCWLSYEPNNTAAKSLYARMGFRENGETDGDEIVAVLPLA
ncbi:MAG: GNAT family N-acetyltransferase [Faecousia sp.]